MNNFLCNITDIDENQAREFDIEGQSIILVNWYGSWFAYLNNCPHANWPLNLEPDAFFDSEHQFLQCSNHMALFDIETGECQAGPCTGDHLKALKVEVRDNQIFVVTSDLL